MKLTEIGVIVVTDKSGNTCVGAAQNPDSPISLGGNNIVGMSLKSVHGDPTCYNGRAGGVEKWAISHGMEYELYTITLDLDAKTVVKGEYIRK